MYSVIYSTMENIEEARAIGRILVEQKLVACVTLLPGVESIYRWHGNIEEDKECILLAKTTENNREKTIQKIKELHSYDLPDIVSFPLTQGLSQYLKWVEDETR